MAAKPSKPAKQPKKPVIPDRVGKGLIKGPARVKPTAERTVARHAVSKPTKRLVARRAAIKKVLGR